MTATLLHPPIRMCIVCRERHPKGELVRWVQTGTGWQVDSSAGRADGRGRYSCQGSCLEQLTSQSGSSAR